MHVYRHNQLRYSHYPHGMLWCSQGSFLGTLLVISYVNGLFTPTFHN